MNNQYINMPKIVFDRCIRIATRCAMHGHPLERLDWAAPTNGSGDPMGVFVVTYAKEYSASEMPCWEDC